MGGWPGGGSPRKPADAARAKSLPEWRTCRAASRCQKKTIPKLLADGLAGPHCPLLPARKGTRGPGPPRRPGAPASRELPRPARRPEQTGRSLICSLVGTRGPGGASVHEHGWFSSPCAIFVFRKASSEETSGCWFMSRLPACPQARPCPGDTLPGHRSACEPGHSCRPGPENSVSGWWRPRLGPWLLLRSQLPVSPRPHRCGWWSRNAKRSVQVETERHAGRTDGTWG